MTVAHWCILLAIGSPYVFTSIAKLTGNGFGFRENHNPRDFLDELTGYRRRAHFAQLNSFEAVPAFSAAVLVAQQVGTAAQPHIDGLAIGFLVARAAYGLCYVADWAVARSLAWFAGISCVTGLFLISA